MTAIIRIPTFEELGLERVDPDDTYIGSEDANECWMGEKWDIARRGPYWDVYRKGNHFAHVHSAETARLIVADEVLWLHGVDGYTEVLLRVRSYLEAQAQLGGPIDHEILHSVHVAGEEHRLLASDLWTLVNALEGESE